MNCTTPITLELTLRAGQILEVTFHEKEEVAGCLVFRLNGLCILRIKKADVGRTKIIAASTGARELN